MIVQSSAFQYLISGIQKSRHFEKPPSDYRTSRHLKTRPFDDRTTVGHLKPDMVAEWSQTMVLQLQAASDRLCPRFKSRMGHYEINGHRCVP